MVKHASMTLRTFLFCAFAILLFIISGDNKALYYYWSALVLVVSYLNSKKAFQQEPSRILNLGFLLYLCFVVWERTRHYHFSDWTELQMNNLEHILFGTVVCTIAYLVIKMPPFKMQSLTFRLFVSALLFNGIGVINEWFQNGLYDRPVFKLIPDSVKDLRMNVWGTSLFVLSTFFIYSFRSTFFHKLTKCRSTKNH